MEKNTIWAIILSALVLFVTMFINYTFIVPKQQENAARQAAEQQIAEEQAAAEIELKNSLISSSLEEVEAVEEDVEEQFYEIKTNKVTVKFTNKGGDIISYQLNEHQDKTTGVGVEMVDNITAKNRAFALSLGNADTNILNEYFKVKVIDDKTIGFYRDYFVKNNAGGNEKVRVSKLYKFLDDEYAFKLDVGLDSENGVDVGGVAYTIRTSPQIGPHFDKNDRYEVREFIYSNGSKGKRSNISNKTIKKDYDWAAVAGKYFTIIVKPEDAGKMTDSMVTSVQPVDDYSDAQLFLSRKATNTKNVVDSYYVYVGPRSESELIKYNSSEKNSWDLVNAKFNQALKTSGFLTIFEVALKWCLETIYKLIHDWGISIIILTVILKAVLFPLNKKTSLGSIKMQQLQPKMQELQTRYADDRQKLAEETQKLYRESGYNPASGCLPMIFQMVVLLAMYNVFNNYFEFRGTTFIPGWIDDLSRGDSILVWEKNIWLLSSLTQNNLRLLPFIYLASQMLNGVITQYGGASAGQSKGQMAFMLYVLPLLFFFMFYNVPSGLLLYWTTSNILQMLQQIIINNIMKKKRAELEKNMPAVNKNVVKFKGGKKKSR